MVAAAFKGVLKFVGLTSRRSLQIPVTVSDVNAELYIFPDGTSVLSLPADEPWALADLTLSAAGTDTSTAIIYVNQRAIPETVMNAANITTGIGRQFQGSPIGLKPGAQLRFKQVT